jgi:hypothetical protein
MIITGSWALVKTVWVTVLIAIPILVWWIYFLLLWPQLIRRSGILENYPRSPQEFPPQGGD